MTSEERYQMNRASEAADLAGRALGTFLFLCEVLFDFERGHTRALELLDGADLPARHKAVIREALDEMDLWSSELFQPGEEASAEDIARYTINGDAS